MTPWPRSMAGQLVALLLISLLATHLLAIALLCYNAELLNPVSLDQALDRFAALHRALPVLGRDDEQRLLQTGDTERDHFWIEAGPPAPHRPASADEEALLAELRSRFPGTPADGVWATLRDGRADPFGNFDMRLGWSVQKVHAAVALPDGRWLHCEQFPLSGYQWWRLLRFSFPVSTLPMMIIVIVFVYRMLRPLKALAQSAERMSRGERAAPLPVQGPSETRDVALAFNLMQERLSRFVADRVRMLAAISHDLRTPLTSMRLRAELVQDPELRAKMVRTLEDLRLMVTEALRFARDDAVAEETIGVDLNTVIAAAADAYPPSAVNVEVGDPLPYRCRPLALRRAISNLIDNAVRHGGGARVRVVREPPPACALRIEVDDDGPGLPSELLERVFEPFFQARQAHEGGVGLGLSIARSCARAHGGDLGVSNRAEGGLRATLTLPG